MYSKGGIIQKHFQSMQFLPALHDDNQPNVIDKPKKSGLVSIQELPDEDQGFEKLNDFKVGDNFGIIDPPETEEEEEGKEMKIFCVQKLEVIVLTKEINCKIIDFNRFYHYMKIHDFIS